MQTANKAEVVAFWDARSCGEAYMRGDDARAALNIQATTRYNLEHYIPGFACFEEGRGLDVLEVGVGMGADHLEWARARPSSLSGVDISPRAITHTHTRFALWGEQTLLSVADAETLPFADESFDIVYSWGVIHHSPDTESAVAEIYRVLRPGGRAKIMIYHRSSLVGYMLWLRYGLLAGCPRTPLTAIYAQRVESPGTKAYSVAEAEALFRGFGDVCVRAQLSFGDLLDGAVGQKHEGRLLELAKRFWPRRLLQRIAKNRGLYLLIDAEK